MKELQYSDAATEVLDILNHTNKEDVEKIPKSFIKFLIKIANKCHKVNFDYQIPISEIDLKESTKELLGFIYITWWSDKEEQANYKRILHKKNN